jgi:hypothetical protein
LKHAIAFYISLQFIYFFMCSLVVEQKLAYLITGSFLLLAMIIDISFNHKAISILNFSGR